MVRNRLAIAGVEFDFHETKAAGDATVQTRTALKAGRTAIAVVGGDGALSEAAEGFFEFGQTLPVPINPNATLAVLPAGTGDDFARGLIGQRWPLEYWVKAFISSLRKTNLTPARSLDVLFGSCDNYTESFICLNASTMGIGGETAARVAAQGRVMRRLSGEARFMVAAAGALVGWRERRVRITVDNHVVVDGPMNLVAVANGLYAGGGMMLSPKAKPDDGLLDVVSVSGLSRAGVMREMPRIHSGGHVANEKVRLNRGAQVRIETFSEEDALLIEADGNLRGRTPVEFRVMPGTLRVVTADPPRS